MPTVGSITIAGEIVDSVQELDEKLHKFKSALRSLHAIHGCQEIELIGTPHSDAEKKESGSSEADGERNSIRYAVAFSESIVNAAIIQLHYALSQVAREARSAVTDENFWALDSQRQCVAAAHEIAHILREDLTFGVYQENLCELDFFIGVSSVANL